MQARAERSNRRAAVAVRRLRRAKGWSQEEMAARCKLHRTYIGAIERAEGNITLDTLDRLAAALGVKSNQLI